MNPDAEIQGVALSPKQQALAALELLRQTLEQVEDTDHVYFHYNTNQGVVPQSYTTDGRIRYVPGPKCFIHAELRLELQNKQGEK